MEHDFVRIQQRIARMHLSQGSRNNVMKKILTALALSLPMTAVAQMSDTDEYYRSPEYCDKYMRLTAHVFDSMLNGVPQATFDDFIKYSPKQPMRVRIDQRIMIDGAYTVAKELPKDEDELDSLRLYFIK